MYNNVVTLIFLLLGIFFLFSSRTSRPVISIISIFLFGLGVDIGIQLEPPKIIAFLAWILIVFRSVRIDAGIYRAVREFYPFFFWAIAIWLIGYVNLEPHIGGFWTRASDGKPLIQMGKIIIYLSLFVIVYKGIGSLSELHQFFVSWLKVATIFSFVGIFQVCYALIFNKPLWGVFRGHDLLDPAFIKLGNINMLRLNAFGGEPKHMGMTLLLSFLVLTIAKSFKLIKINYIKFNFCIGIIFFATFLTFSSGVFLALFLFVIIFLSFSKKRKENKTIFLYFIFLLTVLSIIFTNQNELFKHRIVRLYHIYNAALARNTNYYDMGDKELPAFVFLTKNPKYLLTGVGIGAAPFYYNKYVSIKAHRNQFQEIDSGVLWGIFSFGLIGIGLFFYSFRRIIYGYKKNKTGSNAGMLILGVISAAFAPLNLIIFWVVILSALAFRINDFPFKKNLHPTEPLPQ